MGLSMSSTNFEQQHLSCFLILLFDLERSILSSRPAVSSLRRAQGRSMMVVGKLFIYAQHFQKALLDGPEHGGRL